MTRTHTTHDAATDANTLDADALIEEARATGMQPRSLTPYEQEAATTALAQLETFGRFTGSGSLSPFIIRTVDEMVTDYLSRIPASNRRPSREKATREVAKSIVGDAFDQAYRLGRVALSTDPDDYNEQGWCITAGTPELVWYEKDESSAAAARGEAVWCYLYWPDVYEVASTDPFAEPGEMVQRSGMWNHRGLTGITKTYSNLDDAEADMIATRRAVAALRKLSAAAAAAPDDDTDEDGDAKRVTVGKPRVSLT